MADFTTIVSNNLEEVHMISGDETVLTYYVYNHQGRPLDLSACLTNVYIFKYGDPSYIIADIPGSLVTSGSVKNCFTATFSGSGLSGVYQQQVRIVDFSDRVHVPSQGKIIIFPSSASITHYHGIDYD